jgi:hypothetical protein
MDGHNLSIKAPWSIIFIKKKIPKIKVDANYVYLDNTGFDKQAVPDRINTIITLQRSVFPVLTSRN